VLRCFNDCFATFFLWAAIFLLQRRQWTLASLVFSFGLGIKMSLLLVLPAVGIVLFLGRGYFPALRLANLIVQVQLMLAIPFLMANPWGYVGRAFELSRQFFFKWTVNWRFTGESVFLSRPFSVVLLALHVGLLIVFITTRWLKLTRKSVVALMLPMLSGDSPFTEQEERFVSHGVTPQYILSTVLTANVIGLLCARSLHYQFYAYLAWATPFLLWRSGIHPVFQYILWAVQEWAWNVYPSTPLSSAAVVSSLGLTVFLIWKGDGEEGGSESASTVQSMPGGMSRAAVKVAGKQQ
jgi:alpha-1,3-mannosyltransferase